SQSANTAINVARGGSSFTATNGTLTLDQDGNVFNGAVSLANTGANDVTLTYNGAVTLGNVSVGGVNLTLTTTGPGAITQAANTTINVAGTASFDTNNGAININGTRNSFNGTVTLTTEANGNVTFANNKALSLGNVTVNNGSLSIVSTGNI